MKEVPSSITLLRKKTRVTNIKLKLAYMPDTINRSKKRYSFRKTFWVVAAATLLLSLISLVAVSLMPAQAGDYNMQDLLGWKNMLKLVVSIIFSALYFYLTLNANYRLIAARKGFISYLQVSIPAIVACFVFNAVTYYLFPKFGMPKQVTTAGLAFYFTINSIFFAGLSLLIAYLTSLRDERQQRKVLEQQKMQLEVEKSQANLNFLKAQINPHFLHNTLNFLYAKSLPYSPELSEGILTLSDIMRYALSEGNTQNGKASLKEETEHVRNVIKINQLRFSNNLNVKFEVNGVMNGATIIPFVLITIVENAFKHGDLKNPGNPIEIKLDVTNNRLHFYCCNKKKSGSKEISTGLGLDNIKKRLDYAYGNDYSLTIKDESDFYTTELTINKL